MDISKWTVEDFVLHQAFVDSVLNPNSESTRYWESLLEKNPGKVHQAEQARQLVLRMDNNTEKLTFQDKEALWERVQDEIQVDKGYPSAESFPRRTDLTKKKSIRKIGDINIPQMYRVAAILCVAIGLSWLINWSGFKEEVIAQPEPVAYMDHRLPSGVKSSWILPDGSKVVLNAGSRLRYIKDFEADRRALFLEGEAYFEVAKDSLRPFVVNTGNLSTTAIGTSFAISAYTADSVYVYLLTGKAVVSDSLNLQNQTYLEKGEAVTKDSSGMVHKGTFNEEEVMAWTKGVILFDRTPINVAIKTLENWYGVTFELQNNPPEGLTVSGKFDNEQLKNILEGLSYSARFFFEIEDKKVKIRF